MPRTKKKPPAGGLPAPPAAGHQEQQVYRWVYVSAASVPPSKEPTTGTQA